MDGIDDGLAVVTLWRDPSRVYERLRREAPVWRLPVQNAFLVSTWAAIAEATARVEDFSNHFRYVLFRNEDGTLGTLEVGPTGPDVFAGEDPPLHTTHRRIFFGDLVQRRIDALEPYVRTLADGLIDDLLASDQSDAAATLAHPLPMRVVAERVIGFREPDLDQLRRWTLEGSRLTGGLLTLEEMAERSAEVAPMASWTAAQLDEALSEESAGDILGAAAKAVREGTVTHEQASFALMVFVGAGAETTTSLIGLAIEQLARRPDLQERLRAEPSAIPAFVEEVLRYDSPFRFHPRTVTRDTVLAGVAIPQGALVLLLWASGNRDERVFDYPTEFVLDRPNVHLHFGFGRGVHHCVGAPLARLEARVVLTRLLERTSSITLDPNRPIEWAESIWIHRPDALPVCLVPR